MKNVLYIGNNLKQSQNSYTYMQTLGKLLENEGFSITYASGRQNKIGRLLHMIFTLIRNRKQTDYVLIDTYSTQNFYYAVIIGFLCRIYKLKYLPILHGGNLEVRLKRHKGLSKKLFSSAHALVSPSVFMREIFEKYGFSHIKFIPNSLEIKNYVFAKKSFQTINLLWVRSFSTIYNPQLAIDVVSTIASMNYPVKLCMVGPDKDGSLTSLKNMALKQNLAVEFTGKLSKEDWINRAADYNIFINTTNYDNMPVSVIEAMALGLVVVSTNVGGMPYLIEDGEDGLLVEPNDAESMAKAIIKLHKNPLLAEQLAANARKKVEQFDWEIVRHQWLDILS